MPLITNRSFYIQPVPPVSEFIKTLGGTGSEAGRDIFVDSNNFYVAGTTSSDGVGGYDALFAKYDLNGNVIWQRALGAVSRYFEDGRVITADSNGNVYVASHTKELSSSEQSTVIAKFDSNGTIQWQRRLQDGGSPFQRTYIEGLYADNTALYVASWVHYGSYRKGILVKYNSSGVLQWQRKISGVTSYDTYNDVIIDNVGNIVVVGGTRNTGLDQVLMMKYDSSGTIQWKQEFGGDGFAQFGRSVAIDGSNNIYVGTGSGGELDPIRYNINISKFNSSGTLQWQQAFVVSGTGMYDTSITVDSSGNVFSVTPVSRQNYSSAQFLLVKYNTSGVFQWRRWFGSLYGTGGYGIGVDNAGHFIATGSTSQAGAGSGEVITIKFPDDGTGLDSWGTLAYENTSYGFWYANGSITGVTSTTVTDTAGDLNDSASSLTVTNTTLTETTVL